MKLNIKFALLLCFSLLFLEVPAQQMNRCASMEYHVALIRKYPQLNQVYQKTENDINNFIANKKRVFTGGNTIIIPVVFHVIYNKTVENIGEALIQSQLQVINEDYLRMNSDTISTPLPFVPLAGKADIEFVFANRDLNGLPFNGITRTYTTHKSFDISSDSVKYTALGGCDAWDHNRYLNVWVCNIAGGVLGFATFPGTAAEVDGVVVNYKSFGRPGILKHYDLGRTLTHEIGHIFDLYHIWGDESGCEDSVYPGTDFIDDTPVQATSTSGCPQFPHLSCNNGPDGDMFQNYMDYSYDECMNIFTIDQFARMEAAWSTDTSRIALTQSDAYVPDSSLAAEEFQIYPNPAYTYPKTNRDEINLNFKLLKTQNITLNIYNLYGQFVQQFEFKSIRQKIITLYKEQLRMPASGIYIFHVQTLNSTFSRKVILDW